MRDARERLKDRVHHRHINYVTMYIWGKTAAYSQQELQPFIQPRQKGSTKRAAGRMAEAMPADQPSAEETIKGWELSRAGVNFSHTKKAEKLPSFSQT